MARTKTPPQRDRNWKLTALDLLANHTARYVSTTLGIPETTLNYHLSKWKRMGVIEKKAYGTWKVDQTKRHLVLQKKKRVLRATKQLRKPDPCRSTELGGVKRKEFVVVDRYGKERRVKQDSIGTHGVMFVLRLPGLARWNQTGRRKYLQGKGIEHTPIHQGERLEAKDKRDRDLMLGWKVHLTNKSIVGYAPKGLRWYAETAREGFAEVLYEFLRVVKTIERLLNVRFDFSGKYKIRTKREHHALIGNALGEKYTRDGRRLYVRDARGLWALIDASIEPGEFETVRAGEDGRDANERVVDFFNGVKDTGVTPQGILEMIHGLAANAEYYGEHWRTHVDVLKENKKVLQELREFMRECKNG